VVIVNVAQPLVQASLLGEAIDRGPLAVLVADEEMHFVAVNQFACELLGYERTELLAMRIPDIARSEEAESEYAALMTEGARLGTTSLTRKDGRAISFRYHASETTVAGLPLYVAIGWPEGPPSEPTPPPRRRARESA
jgi:PAS domain S-box-containing protein